MSTRAETGDHDRETTATGGERVTFQDTDGQLEVIDTLVDRGVYPNRSDPRRVGTARVCGIGGEDGG